MPVITLRKCDGGPPSCRNPPEYHVVAGCLRKEHVCNYECCLSHVLQIKRGFETREEEVYCMTCFREEGMLVLVDDLIIEAYSGQEISVETRVLQLPS